MAGAAKSWLRRQLHLQRYDQPTKAVASVPFGFSERRAREGVERNWRRFSLDLWVLFLVIDKKWKTIIEPFQQTWTRGLLVPFLVLQMQAAIVEMDRRVSS